MGRSSVLDGLTTLPELLMQSIQKNGDREALRQYERATGNWRARAGLAPSFCGDGIKTWGTHRDPDAQRT